MKQIFVDTSAFYALADRKDPAHVRAKQFLESNEAPLLTNNYVFSETLSLLTKRLGKPRPGAADLALSLERARAAVGTAGGRLIVLFTDGESGKTLDARAASELRALAQAGVPVLVVATRPRSDFCENVSVSMHFRCLRRRPIDKDPFSMSLRSGTIPSS